MLNKFLVAATMVIAYGLTTCDEVWTGMVNTWLFVTQVVENGYPGKRLFGSVDPGTAL